MSRHKHLTILCTTCPLLLIVCTLRLCCCGYRFKTVFTANDKQLIKSSRHFTVTVHESSFKNFHREIGHAEDLIAHCMYS